MAESPTSSDYPGSLDSWVTLTDKEDLAEVSDINKIKNSLLATQTELGTDPAGTKTDLVTRLAQCIATNGAMRNGTSFPGSGEQDGDFFYRTDENVMYIYNGSGWDSQGQSLGNVIFSWSGNETVNQSANGYGMIVAGTDLTPDPNTGVVFLFATEDTTQRTFCNFQFTKISGIATVTIHARLWAEANGASQEAILNVDIGGQANTVKSVTSTTPTWVTTADIDVSGLSDGTVYDGVVQLATEAGASGAYCSAVTLIAS